MSLKTRIESELKQRGPLSYAELAGYVGAPIPSVRRSLGGLVKAGKVLFHSRTFQDASHPQVKRWFIQETPAPHVEPETTSTPESTV